MTNIQTPDYIPCADADLNVTNRGHCYEGWTQFRDWREADEDETVGDIASYRAGYLHALNRTADLEAKLATATKALDDAREVLAGWLTGVEYDESLKAYDIIDKALTAISGDTKGDDDGK